MKKRTKNTLQILLAITGLAMQIQAAVGMKARPPLRNEEKTKVTIEITPPPRGELEERPRRSRRRVRPGGENTSCSSETTAFSEVSETFRDDSEPTRQSPLSSESQRERADRDGGVGSARNQRMGGAVEVDASRQKGKRNRRVVREKEKPAEPKVDQQLPRGDGGDTEDIPPEHDFLSPQVEHQTLLPQSAPPKKSGSCCGLCGGSGDL